MSKRIPPEEIDKVESYINYLKELLNINEYEIFIMEKTTKEGDAIVKVKYKYKMAEISLSNNWMDLEHHRKTRVLFHEMIHVLSAGILFAAKLAINSAPKDKRALLDEVWDKEIELFTSHIESNFCDTLLDWPEDE